MCVFFNWALSISDVSRFVHFISSFLCMNYRNHKFIPGDDSALHISSYQTQTREERERKKLRSRWYSIAIEWFHKKNI